MKLSIIMPVHAFSHKDIGLTRRAVSSVLRQDSPDWELIISPDDAQNDLYKKLFDFDPRIKIVPNDGTQPGSGPAETRNRAMRSGLVTGNYVVNLDHDDTVDEKFVSSILGYFSSNPQAVSACFTTGYSTGDGCVLRWMWRHDTMTINEFSVMLGSMPAVVRRDRFPDYQNTFAEDVIHTCRAIDLNGGRVDIIHDAHYRIFLHQDSFSNRIKKKAGGDYLSIIESPREAYPGWSEQGFLSMKNLFEHRLHVNNLFASQRTISNYHVFIVNHRLVNTDGQSFESRVKDSDLVNAC